MNKFVESFKDRVDQINATSDAEAGMEAAQVILILFLVVIGLIPVIVFIRNKLAAKASSVGPGIDNAT